MAEEALVESLVLDSIKLVEELDKQGDAPTNALWYFASDAEEWLFLVAGRTFDSLLPQNEIQAYEKIGRAITNAGFYSLSIANAVIRAHFRGNVFNGVFVKEMLVLRAA